MLKYEERGQEEPGLHLVSHIKESKVHLEGKNKTKNKPTKNSYSSTIQWNMGNNENDHIYSVQYGNR